MSEKPNPGVAELSLELHNFISQLVFKNDSDALSDRPFETIGYAFRFAFGLGFRSNTRKALTNPRKDIGVRGFRPEDFMTLVEDICIDEKKSLGAVISEYAEHGANEMRNHLSEGGSLLQLLNEST